jgi:hypothetical protein
MRPPQRRIDSERMDFLAVILGLAAFALLLWMIDGVDRI